VCESCKTATRLILHALFSVTYSLMAKEPVVIKHGLQRSWTTWQCSGRGRWRWTCCENKETAAQGRHEAARENHGDLSLDEFPGAVSEARFGEKDDFNRKHYHHCFQVW